MVVDHEAVLADLKAYLAEKPQHGATAVLAEIGKLEAAHRVEETLPERALRSYGIQFGADLRADARNRAQAPSRPGGSSAGPMGPVANHQPDNDERDDDGSTHHAGPVDQADAQAGRPARAA